MITVANKSNNSDFIMYAYSIGVRDFRFNMDYEEESIEAINRIRSLKLQDIHLFADFQGVKMRLHLENGLNDILYQVDDYLYIYTSNTKYPYISNYTVVDGFVKPGFIISFADDRIEAIIRRVHHDGIEVQFTRVNYVLRQNAGCSIKGEGMPTPHMTKNVCGTILNSKIISQGKIDWVILSFVEDAEEISSFVSCMHKMGIKVMAKIETKRGVDNIHAIASVVDGFMIGRGDLKNTAKEDYESIYRRALSDISQYQNLYIGVGTFFLSKYSDTKVLLKKEILDIENIKAYMYKYIMLSKEVVNSNYPYETIKLLQDLCIK